MASSSPTKKQMTNQSVALSTKSPSAASPASSNLIQMYSPTSLADLSVHNAEEEVKDLTDFDMIGKKCANQRYGGEIPNKPRAYEPGNRQIAKMNSEATYLLENLVEFGAEDLMDNSSSFPLLNHANQDDDSYFQA